MRMKGRRILFLCLVLIIIIAAPGYGVKNKEGEGRVGVVEEEHFEEGMWIRRLPNGYINTWMEFTISKGHGSNVNHTTLFPRTLLEILTAHRVEELHFSLTQGHWRLEGWGDPEPASMAPTGAHLVAWFSGDKNNADSNWRGLTNRLSGLTCASLNFLDQSTSIEPKFAYRPVGNFNKKHAHVRVGALPREFICTENLTPWTKLLPCGVMRGLASLLRTKQVFNTHYHSAHIRFVKTKTQLELKLSLHLVFNNPSSAGQHEHFVKNVFGSMAFFPCHVARNTSVQLQGDTGLWRPVGPEELNNLRLRDIPENTPKKNLIFTPVKYLGGYGQEYGKMVVEMTNHLKDKFLSVLYVEVLPWYVRPYLHTTKVEVIHGQQKLPLPPGKHFHYTPGVDRITLHKLEMDLQIPPSSKVTLSFLVEKGHLKWDEYPPDANHGFYLEAAQFEVNITGEEESTEPRHYYSRVLLINLSTPDFSMPYNVICLTCTVVALAFGPIHNITTKRLQMKELTQRSAKLNKLWKKLMIKLGRATEEESEPTVVPAEEDNSKSEGQRAESESAGSGHK